MAQAKSGDSVKIHYNGTLENGEVFDSSTGSDPFEFTLGAGMVIPGFDKAVEGMEIGESKTVTIPPDEAYGFPSEELVGEINKTHLPEDIQPEIGMTLQLKAPDGNNYPVRVKAILDESILLDGNHPLAGETLTFGLELISIGEG